MTFHFADKKIKPQETLTHLIGTKIQRSKLSSILIRITLVLLVVKSNKNYKSFDTWLIFYFLQFLKFIMQYFRNRCSQQKIPAINFVPLIQLSNFFSENAHRKSAQTQQTTKRRQAEGPSPKRKMTKFEGKHNSPQMRTSR